MMRFIQTNDALKPNGHYSQAIEHCGIVYCSGILPFDSVTGKFVSGDVETQCNVVFQNLKNILETSGSSIDMVIKTTIYIPDIKLWEKINVLYGEFFGSHKPCRTIVPCGILHFNSNIELEVIASLKK